MEEIARLTLRRRLLGGVWNTLCLPLAVTRQQLADVFGCDVELRTLLAYTYGIIDFQAADAIAAGLPFLVRPAEDVVDPTFPLEHIEAATPQSVGDADCQFVGTFNPVTLPEDDGYTCVFLTAEGKLKKPAADRRTLGPFRAYFRVSDACRQLPTMMIYEIINKNI
jgi:hypothetical protein